MDKRMERGKGLWRIVQCMLFGILIMGMGTVAFAESEVSLEGKMSENGSVWLSWVSDDKEALYQLQRAENENGSFKVIAGSSNQQGTIAYYDNAIILGKTYYYKVTKYAGEQMVGESAVIKIITGLGQPQNVKIKKIKESKVEIHWDSVAKADGYQVYRSTKRTKGYKKVASVKTNVFNDENVSRGKVYYYKIYAIKKRQGTLKGNPSEVTAAYMKPEAPKLTGSCDGKKIKITWKKVKGAGSYVIYKKNRKNVFKKVAITKKLSYTDKKIKTGKSYQYKVKAVYQRDGKTIEGKCSSVCKVLASSIDPNKKMVALTFDDGPGPYTNDILNCLKQNHGKATFFVVGSRIDYYKDTVRYADKLGCEIANHTYNHPNLVNLSVAEIENEINATNRKIKEVTGKVPLLVRTPGGSFNDTVRATVNKPLIMWSIDTRDWATQNKEKTVYCVKENVKDGDIILMHDIYGPTRDAACELIYWLKQEGYQMVTVSELAYYRGYSLKSGSVYYSFRKYK